MPLRPHRDDHHLLLAICTVLGAGLSSARSAADEPNGAAGPRAMLQLADGAFLAGELRASDDPKIVRWQSPAFARPLDFDLEAVQGAHFPAPSGVSRPDGEYCFELANGDVVFGSLVELSDEEAVIDSARLGRLKIRREELRSLFRWNVAELIHSGPNGLAGWKETPGLNLWREEIGQPLTDRPGASLFADPGIPPKAMIEFELSWKTHPDFSLAFGVNDDPRVTGRAYRLEVLWSPKSSKMILPDARQGEPVQWEYTTDDPGDDWFKPEYKGTEWKVGPAGFGTSGTPGSIVGTEWSTKEIWMRHRFKCDSEAKSIALTVHHDEDVRVWINGRLVHERAGFRSNYETVSLERSSRLLHEGENTIAVNCRQTGGGQYVDVGILDLSSLMSGDLVAIRETDGDADIASVQQVSFEAGRTHLVVYLDQELGQLMVLNGEGAKLADLKSPPGGAQALGGLRLTNNGGDVRLERLRISRWGGATPREVDTQKPRVLRVDGSVVYGRLSVVDPETKQFVVRDGNEEARVPFDQLASAVLSPPKATAPGAFRSIYLDGTQVSGELVRIDADHLELKSPGVLESMRMPLSGLRSFMVLKSREPNAKPEAGETLGKLELEGLSLPGRLINGREQPEESCLVWQPIHCKTASPLRPGVTGRISYREPAPPPKPAPAPKKVGMLQGLINSIRGVKAAPRAKRNRSLHLRNGDAIPCKVSRMDENGVSFRSPLSKTTYVPNDKIKAVELQFGDGPPIMPRAKRDRLLMLPRMQSPSPPTHLVRSRGGDFLRGNVLALDDKVLRVEVHSEAKEIQRNRVSHIIWLHADELPKPPPPPPEPPAAPAAGTPAPAVAPAATASTAPAPTPPAPTPPSPAAAPAVQPDTATRVQARLSDGNRLTFFPEQLEGTTLSGKSSVLGACHVDLTQLDELRIGARIESSISNADLAYNRWKLYRAIDPIYIQVLNGPIDAGPTPGIDSGLVGKPAPDFELDLLDGKKFRLSGSKGRVVVLDFWATWCGPCLQLMPRIERVVRELKDSRVELVAVNLEEPASQVSALLERHKLQLTVALDRDGVVAAKYEATAIPQTVIVDRDGKIARLFVGGGAQVADQVRDAVRGLLPAQE